MSSPKDEVQVEKSKKTDKESKVSNAVCKYRKTLPCKMFDRTKGSIWTVLSQCVGKDLYRFTLPIIWNEPLSLLQKSAENIKFADDRLDRAANSSDPIERMKMVASFIISGSSINVLRISKPFNPLLGETYEFVNPEKSNRIFCEQVSHHPPITAFYAESLQSKGRWRYYGSINPVLKLNIMSASVETAPEGIQTVEFPDLNETYTWFNPKVFAHNLIIGKMWFEIVGQIEIVNHKLNMKCVLDFKPYSWFSGSVSRVDGYIVDANDNKLTLLAGKWDEYFYATKDITKQTELLRAVDNHPKHVNEKPIELLWELKAHKDELTKCLPEYYNFTEFTIKLNDLLEEHIKPTTVPLGKNTKGGDAKNTVSIGPIAPTDCRWRPDLRLYEKGILDMASNEKIRLEEKQREKRRAVEAGDVEEWKPLWFEQKPHHIVGEAETWTFNDKYWQRDYSQCPDIY